MGRELKRVPLDFNWPIGKVWDRYLNPYTNPCPEVAKGRCYNGSSPAGQWLEAISIMIAIVGEEARDAHRVEEFKARGRSYPHPYLTEWALCPTVNHRVMSLNDPKLVSFVQVLSGKKEPDPLGGYSRYEIYNNLLKAAGITEKDWGFCPVCKGTGIDPEIQEKHDAWTPTEPPVGEGYQLWETTSEGSPISPVFKTLNELCEWCENNASTFASFKTTKDEWKKMLSKDLVYHKEGQVIFM